MATTGAKVALVTTVPKALLSTRARLSPSAFFAVVIIADNAPRNGYWISTPATLGMLRETASTNRRGRQCSSIASMRNSRL
jgi:hypothetical protein